MNKSAIMQRAHKTARNLMMIGAAASYRAALSQGLKRAWENAKAEADRTAPTTTPRVIYLNVPYSQKEKAKKAGAKWDATARSWYVIATEVPFALTPWADGSYSARILSTTDYVA